MAHRTEELRNVALIGHGHGGKTTLVEAMLRVTRGKQNGKAAESCESANCEPEERERKHTLIARVYRVDFDGVAIQAIDTPGHPDFVGEAIASLCAADIACLVVSAASPLSFHARQLWKLAGDAGLARAIVVTHLDHEGVDFEALVARLRETLGHVVAPLTYPVATGNGFAAVRDVLTHHSPRADRYHDWIEEDEAEVDDEALKHYLENGHLDPEEFDRCLVPAMARGLLVPLFAVRSATGVGVEAFLRFLVRHAPSPLTFGPRRFGLPAAVAESDAPFVGHVFKVVVDPYVGRLAHVRCIQGALLQGQRLVAARTGTAFDASHLLRGIGKEAVAVSQAAAGELVSIAKVDDLRVGDVVAARAVELHAPPLVFPTPTYARHVWPKSRADESKIGAALEKLCVEDPTLRTRRDAETGELLVEGLSPLHVEVQLQRMHRRWQVAVETGSPSIAYRETPSAAAHGHHRHKKQTGGRGQFAEVYARVRPLPRGEGFAFVDAVVGGAVPRQFVPEVEKGARRFLQRGALAAFPVVDVAFEVYDGKHHDVDSDQLSFQIAGERAFHEAFLAARPVLLEPIMSLVVHVPERCTGDVSVSLSGMRGRLLGMSVENGIQRIEAEAPLASLLDYATQLRSLTGGEGTFSTAYARHELVPAPIQAEIVRQRRSVLHPTASAEGTREHAGTA
jgi:elongation factor G